MQNRAGSQNPFQQKDFSYGYRFSNKTPAAYRNPGVGDYNILDESPRKNQEIKFPKGQRTDYVRGKMYIPGPGTYDLIKPKPPPKKELRALHSTISPDLSQSNASPSPVITKKMNSKSYLFETNLQEIPEQSSNGFVQRRTIETSFLNKKGSLSPTSNKTPGPGTYNVAEVEARLFKKPSAIIGTSNRMPEPFKDGIAGDAYYSYNSQEYIGPNTPLVAFATGKRFDMIMPDSPGPGTYDTLSHELAKSSVSVSIGKSPKLTKIIPDVPGPGRYGIDNSSFHKGVIIPRSIRPGPSNIDLPGPGSYNIVDEFTEKKKAADKKMALKKLLASARSLSDGVFDLSSLNLSKLSPNDVSNILNHTVHRSNSSNILPDLHGNYRTSKPTFIDTLIYNDSSPGPVYFANNNSIETSKTGARFSVEPRPPINLSELKKESPGPGNYNDHYKKSQKGEHSFFKGRRPSLADPQLKRNPGPGDYENLLDGPAYGGAIGKAERRIAKYD